MRFLAALLSSLVLTGCAGMADPDFTRPGVICTAIAVSSLNVAVRDTATGQPGYEAKRVTGIRVGRDECHVIPVSLTVDLRPGS